MTKFLQYAQIIIEVKGNQLLVYDQLISVCPGSTRFLKLSSSVTAQSSMMTYCSTFLATMSNKQRTIFGLLWSITSGRMEMTLMTSHRAS